MKITILIDFLPDACAPGGGVQHYTLNTAQTLQSLGHEVTLLCRSAIPQQDFSFRVKQAKVSYRDKKLLGMLKEITFHRLDNSLTMLFDARAFGHECSGLPSPDIIQSPNYKIMGLFVNHQKARLIVRASSFRPIWTAEVKPSTDGKVSSWLEAKLFKRADAVFAPSQYLARMLETKLGRKVDVIPTPIPSLDLAEDPGWYDSHLSGRKYMLYFGTILERKGLFVLAEALKQVWQEQPDVLLVLAGPDLVVDGKSNLERVMEIIGENQQNVIHIDNLSQTQLFPVIRRSHFVVLPSIEDNSPNSMLEAMALGKAVLGTTGSSLDEFYPPDCADLLVPRAEVEPLARKIAWLWSLPQEKLDAFGAECKQNVEERHSPAAAASALLDYYRRILGQS